MILLYTQPLAYQSRIEFDELFWNDTVTKLKHFYDTYIVSDHRESTQLVFSL